MEIKVYKNKKCLEVWKNNNLQKTYLIAVGKDITGHKEREGDMRTPEGEYIVCLKNPDSSYHLSFAINYPNNQDAEQGLKKGLLTEIEYQSILAANNESIMPLQKTALGGEIYVHGDLEKQDWSHGCIRMYNPDIEELFKQVRLGTPVAIFP